MSAIDLTPLDPLDRRIVAALQIDGRATWARIAEVLDEPVRTVARRGAHLVESGAVVVAAVPNRMRVMAAEPTVLAVRCKPSTSRIAAAGLARHHETTYSYLTTGEFDVVAEAICIADRLSTLLLDELPAIPGVDHVQSYPVTRFYRTVHDWQPGILDPAEAEAMTDDRTPTPIEFRGGPVPITSEERTMLRALVDDGRRTHEELARLAGVSEATARRRVESLRARGLVFFRAVVEPSLLGLPVEALLWIRLPSDRIDEVGSALLDSPLVRYVAAVAGPHQLLVDITLPDRAALHEFMTASPWVSRVHTIEISLVISALKRSAVLSQSIRGQRSDEF